MGFPGNPKNNFSFLLNLDNIIGRPGFIETPLKYVLKLSSFISFGIKSNLPADIAPEVTNISISDLRARITAHNEGQTKSTRGRIWKLVYYEAIWMRKVLVTEREC